MIRLLLDRRARSSAGLLLGVVDVLQRLQERVFQRLGFGISRAPVSEGSAIKPRDDPRLQACRGRAGSIGNGVIVPARPEDPLKAEPMFLQAPQAPTAKRFRPLPRILLHAVALGFVDRRPPDERGCV